MGSTNREGDRAGDYAHEQRDELRGAMSWRVGGKVPLNVYDGDRPVCQCHNEVDALRIVAAMNNLSIHTLSASVFPEGYLVWMPPIPTVPPRAGYRARLRPVWQVRHVPGGAVGWFLRSGEWVLASWA